MADPPGASTTDERRFISSASVVDISSQILVPSIAGSIFSTTAAEATGDGRQVITASQTCIKASGPSTIFGPSFDELRDNTAVQIMNREVKPVA
ncbi:MAG: hypothetical protein U5K38_06030 [Woeseiaceae bacterium]|nr:hypothetical protein [Woeseiaceae bacterium]